MLSAPPPSAASFRQRIPALLLVASTATALSGVIAFLLLHVQALRRMESAVPFAVLLSQEHSRLQTLERQLEAEEMEAVLRSGAAADAFRAYVAPSSPERERLLAFLETVTDALRRDRLLSHVAPVRLTELSGAAPAELGVEFAVDGTAEGVRTLLLLLQWSGLLTVSDVLTDGEVALLLQASEQENPAGIVAIEQFFLADLLGYARDPVSAEAQVRRSFTSSQFTRVFDDILSHSELRDVRRVLGGQVGAALEAQKLWPVRFLFLEQVDIRDVGESVHAELKLRAAGRREQE